MGARGPQPGLITSRLIANFVPGAPEPPDWIDDVAKEEFLRVCKNVGSTFFQVDLALLTLYSQAYSDVKRLKAELDEEGETLISEKTGNAYCNPKYSILITARKTLFDAACKLGFSPPARAALGHKPLRAKENPLAAFANKLTQEDDGL